MRTGEGWRPRAPGMLGPLRGLQPHLPPVADTGCGARGCSACGAGSPHPRAGSRPIPGCFRLCSSSLPLTCLGRQWTASPKSSGLLPPGGGGPDGVLVLATGMLRKFQVLSQHMEDSISPPLSVCLAKRLKKPSIRLYVGGPSGHGDSCCHEGPPDAGAGADTSHRRGVGRTGPCPCTRRTREAGRPHAVPRQWVSARGGSGARSSTSKHPHLRQHRVTRL